jgi:hypothetical protein
LPLIKWKVLYLSMIKLRLILCKEAPLLSILYSSTYKNKCLLPLLRIVGRVLSDPNNFFEKARPPHPAGTYHIVYIISLIFTFYGCDAMQISVHPN